GGGLLDQESGCADLHGLLDVDVVAVRRKDDDLGGRHRLENLSGGFHAVEQRHGDIHDDHPGKQLPGQPHGFPPGPRFAAHLEVRFCLPQPPEPFSDDRVVVGQQDGDRFHDVVISHAPDGYPRPPNGTCARTVVPLPGSDSRWKVPPTISMRSRMPSSPRRTFFVSVRRFTSKDLPLSCISIQTSFFRLVMLTFTRVACECLPTL